MRPLEESELKAAIDAQNSEEAIRAVTLTVSQTDGVMPVTKQEEAKVAELAAPKQTAKVEKAEAEEVEEPKKISKKPTAEVKEKSSLDDIVGEWDD